MAQKAWFSIIIPFFSCFIGVLHGTEYLYPVMETHGRVFLMHQHQQGLDLLEWDPVTKYVSQALASWYTPTNVTLMPSGEAFSFIDNDTIKIKAFNQRSPYTIPLDMPLYNFSIIHWIDDEHCYGAAQKQGVFGIYEIARDGHVKELVFDKAIDCMYPQKVDLDLYYIARRFQNNTYYYSIRRCNYTDECHSPQIDEIYLDCGMMPIAFLSLLPVVGKGVLSYEIDVSNEQEEVVFHYFLISDEGYKEIFSFNIPKSLLFDQLDRLYESLLPLLPRVRGNRIYFVCSDSIYYYDLVKEVIIKCSVSSYFLFCFVPLLSGLYGGSLKNNNDIPCIDIAYNEQRSLYACNIPSI